MLQYDPSFILQQPNLNVTDIISLVSNFDRAKLGKLKLPEESLKNQFTCVKIDSPHCVKSNLFELKKTLHSTDINGAINHIQFYSSSRTNKTYGVQLDDGSIVDLAGLKNLKFLCKLIQSQKEVKEENQWLRDLSNLMKFPNGISNEDFLVTATQFVSLIQAHQDDEEIQPINLRVDHIKLLIGTRLICDSFLSWISAKINQDSQNTFCIQYLEEFIGDTWRNALKPRFTKAFPRAASLRNIIVFLNVGRYIDSDGNYITFIGERYDENGGKLISCHYIFHVR